MGKISGGGISTKSASKAVDGFDSLLVCEITALAGLELALLEDDVSLSVDVCGIEVEFSKPADFVLDLVEEVEFESL